MNQTLKDRFFILFETFLSALKFRGVIYSLKWLFYAVQIRFFVPESSRVFKVFGYRFHYSNKGSLLHSLYEMFGSNEYFFSTNNQSPIIIDLGANVGDSILYFKNLYKDSIIYGFEPNPTAYKLLEKNVQENNLKNVTVFNEAVGIQEEVLKLYDDSSDMALISSLSKSFVDKWFEEKNINKDELKNYEVLVKKLSGYDFFKRATFIDLLKIDIEGSETKVLKEIAQQLHKINRIILEFHLTPDMQENSFDEACKILKDNNFNIFISGFYRHSNNLTTTVVFIIQAQNKNGKY